MAGVPAGSPWGWSMGDAQSLGNGLSAVVEHRDGAVTYVLRGDIDVANIGTLEKRLLAAAGVADQRVDLDMSAVGFVDSTGIRGLIDVSRALDARGGRLRIVSASDSTHRILRLTGLADLLGPGG